MHTSAHTVQARSLLAPFDDSCNHMWWKISFSLSEIFSPDCHSSPLTSPPIFSLLPVVSLCSSLSSLSSHTVCTSASLFILHLPLALTLHLSPPCGRLIPLSYSFFCPKDIFPPTRPRLIPLSPSIYLYQ